MRCAICENPVTAVHADVDPRRGTLMFMAQCGHLITRDEAHEAWRRGMRWHTPQINGATLVGAERARQGHEEGYTTLHDVAHEPGDLAWAAWCYLDAMRSTEAPDPANPPKMWPWEPEAWKPDKTPLRLLVIAGALIAAEIDARLARGEKLA